MAVLTAQSGPFNIEQGNTAAFVVEFFDVNGVLSIPTSPGMTITYTNTLFNSQTDTIALSLNGGFFTGSWVSNQASLGLATWIATAPSSNQVATGQIRVIQRKGN